MVMLSRFGHKVVVVLAMAIRGICYYEINTKNKTTNVAQDLWIVDIAV